MKIFGTISITVLVAVLLSGCTAMKKMKVGMAENPYVGQPESIVRGATIYQANCVRCHGETGVGDGVDVATLKSPPADLTNYASENTVKAAAMNITYGKNEMPPYVETLTQDQIWDVSNYVISLTPTADAP